MKTFWLWSIAIVLAATTAVAQDTARDQRKAQRPQQQAGAVRQIRPTHANVPYGPHDRNVMDVWLADSEAATRA